MLFALLRQRGYGDDYVRRYQMVTRFFQQKRPLIILVAGSACTGAAAGGPLGGAEVGETGCVRSLGRHRQVEQSKPCPRCVCSRLWRTSQLLGRLGVRHASCLRAHTLAALPAGKSSLAQQLASRLNLPNVLQTDVLYEVGASCWVCKRPVLLWAVLPAEATADARPCGKQCIIAAHMLAQAFPPQPSHPPRSPPAAAPPLSCCVPAAWATCRRSRCGGGPCLLGAAPWRRSSGSAPPFGRRWMGSCAR